MQNIIQWIQATFGPEVDWKQVFLISMSPIFLIAFGIEWFYLARMKGRSEGFYWKDTLANLSLGAGYQVMEALMWIVLTGGVFTWIYQHRLFDIPVTAWTVLPIFVGVEFCYYWFHRCSHRIRWFWAAHVAHHAGEHMNFTMAMRQSILNAFIGSWIFYTPPVLLGVKPGVVMFMLAVDLAYQYFVHTDSVRKLPRWYEYIFDTPSNHRVHHGKNPKYIDKNYGGVLIIFDRWFGTYEPEIEQPVYGIPRQVHSYNFFVLNFHELVDIVRDVLRPGPLWLRIKHLWAPPEWVRPGDTPHAVWGDHAESGAKV